MKRMIIWLVILTMLVTALPGTLPAAQATMCAQHTWSAWQQEREATCTSPGWQTRYCTVCGNGWDSREYPSALGHNFQFVVRDQPTCTTPGYGIDTCTRCGANRDNGRRIDALGHNYQRKVAQEATCTKDGTAVYTCSRCGDSYREPIPATGHKWGEWVDGDPATCVQYGNRYHQCTRCGQKEWERNYAGGLGDHDWGEWVTVKEPTATEPGLQERTCKVEASHKEQQEIPATGEPAEEAKPALELVMGLWIPELWVKESGWWVPNPDKEAINFVDDIILDYYNVINTGNVPLLTKTVVTTGNNVEILNDILELRKMFLRSLNPGESWDFAGLSFSHWASEEAMIPDPEDSPYAGTYKETWIVYGYALDDTEYTTPICKSNAYTFECKIAKPGPHPSLLLEVSWAPDAGEGKRYEGAIVPIHHKVTNVGDCPVYRFTYISSATDIAFPSEATYIPEFDKVYVTIQPGESWTYTENYDVSVYDVEKGIIESKRGDFAFYIDTEGETGLVDSNAVPINIPLTYPDGYESEPDKPAIKLTVNQLEPEMEAFKDGEEIRYEYAVTNTGNIPLRVDVYFKGGTGGEFSIPFPKSVLDPGETWCSSEGAISYFTVSSNHMIPDPEDSSYAGSYPMSFKAYGYAVDDKDHTTPICDDGPITFDHKVAKPGPSTWPIPEESQLIVDIYDYGSDDPAGYQLGEGWDTLIVIRNKGSVDIDDYTIHVEYVASYPCQYKCTTKGSGSYELPRLWKAKPLAAGDSESPNITWTYGDQSPWGYVAEEDVERGYIQVNATVKWIDPDSGNERTATDTCSMPVISKTGLLLNKGFKAPANGEYFEEGEQIEWTLSVKNNSKEDLTNVTVTDYGTTLATYATFAAGQEEAVSVPKYTVTEYDAKVTGKVTNIANATGTDLKGVEHTYPSNPAVAKAGNKAPDPNDGDGGGGTDPLGPIYGYDIAVSIIKAEAHGPVQEDWYALNENVDYTVTVKNTGKDPIENVTVYDSLNGFAPIGTVGSLAPGEEKTFSFTWKVTQYNVDVMHYVVNQATVTYTFGGGINGTPMKSNKVYVKAGENGFIPEDGIIDPDGDPDGHFDPGLLHGEGDDCCAMTLFYTGDNEAYYQLTLCGEHAKVIADAKAAADAGDWKTAAETIRTALDEIYTKYYEAGDDSAKAAVMNERLTYYAHIGAYQTLAGDKAAAEKMALKLIQLCSMANTAPETLPDSLANGMNGILGDNPDVTATGRVIGLFDDKNEVTDTYAGADARALKGVKNLLKAAKSYNFDEVFERGQVIWQTALDESVNAIYKAADRETRKQIAAWRISLDNLYTGERPMLEMLYPDNDTAVEEILMNLYRDTTLDKEQVR